MHASPAFQFVLSRFGVWRSGVALAVGLAIAALSAWLATRGEPLQPLVLTAWVGALFGTIVLGGSLMRVPAAALQWDGRQWWLAPAVPGRSVAIADQGTPGDIEVALDLGGWMLLRFRANPWPPYGSRSTWLPAQRRGLEAQWHALRCAVYSPRPAPARDAADSS